MRAYAKTDSRGFGLAPWKMRWLDFFWAVVNQLNNQEVGFSRSSKIEEVGIGGYLAHLRYIDFSPT
jgi:hypothetical protein